MESVYKKINSVDDLKKLNFLEKKKLAEELRAKVIEVVSKNGGHLASNLGIVELTIALHSVFNTPRDLIIWDVGHQTYVHKILTGRKDKFETLRKLDGLAGFPKSCESEFDAFNTGHSSTSISVALGMARARDILKKNQKVIAVIGDGALTGGMAEEALNDAGASNTNIIVILNDNEMSISKNVGGVALLLAKVRAKKFYTRTNKTIKNILETIPKVGVKIIKCVNRAKNSIKQFFIPKMYFEDIGFTYLGPVDGNDIEVVENILKQSKEIDGPILVHLVTKKGKGYKFAEENPSKFHSVPPFNIQTGQALSKKKQDYSAVFGEKVVELASKDRRIVAVTAAMMEGTGLKNFKELYPDRFFDVGIAEQHAVGMAAGMAKSGLIPIVPIYASFYQRAYDQVIHDVCMQNLHVIMCADRAGIVGNDGETHQGLLDLASFSVVPNLTIMAPKNFEELRQMLDFAVKINSPVFIRYPRGNEIGYKFEGQNSISYGKAELIEGGKDITIVAIGKMVERGALVSKKLKEKNINAELINVRFLKPFDESCILESIKKTRKVVTIEDGNLRGGLATSVNETIIKNNLSNIVVKNWGYDDKYVQHGTVDEIEKINGLDCDSLVKGILEMFK